MHSVLHICDLRLLPLVCAMTMLAMAVLVVGDRGACDEPFGELLGEAFGVPAFSNCNDTTTSDESNHVSYGHTGHRVYTGMKWQCVEYARRFMLLHDGCLFDNVSGAVDIWDLKHVKVMSSDLNQPYRNETRSFRRFFNHNSTYPPAIGDLVIWSVQKDMPYGHVGVVVGVSESRESVYLADQNYCSKKWAIGTNYSRTYLLRADPIHRHVSIEDREYVIIGWLRLSEEADPIEEK